MYKSKFLKIVLIILILISTVNISTAAELESFHKIDSLALPEKDINIKIDKLTRGAEVYLFIPRELFKYNLEQFMNNNIENQFEIQKQKSERLKSYLDKNDFVGYINYFKEFGFEVDENVIELRHYCFSINDATEIIGETEYNGSTYIKFKITPIDGQFKIIMKDYLAEYDASKITFFIEEYGKEVYIPVSDYAFAINTVYPNKNECNINYIFHSDVDYDEIDKSIFIAYLVIFILIFIFVIIILIIKIKKYKKHKKELEEIMPWKKKLSKEEKKALKLEKKKKKK